MTRLGESTFARTLGVGVQPGAHSDGVADHGSGCGRDVVGGADGFGESAGRGCGGIQADAGCAAVEDGFGSGYK
jgi:hypothetical protein